MLEEEIPRLGDADHEPGRWKDVQYHPLVILVLAIAGTLLTVWVSRLLGI